MGIFMKNKLILISILILTMFLFVGCFSFIGPKLNSVISSPFSSEKLKIGDQITLSSNNTESTEIRYTLDNISVYKDSILYEGPITVTEDNVVNGKVYLHAQAYDGNETSPTLYVEYNIYTPQKLEIVKVGSRETNQIYPDEYIIIKCEDSNNIRYSIDGSDVDINSLIYDNNPIVLEQSNDPYIIKVKEYKDGKEINSIEEKFYVVKEFNSLSEIQNEIKRAIDSNEKDFEGDFNYIGLSKSITSLAGLFSNIKNYHINENFKEYASKFNGDISQWDTSNITNFLFLFAGAKNFNRELNNWNTSNVNQMSSVFYKASVFNQELSSWDTSNVTNMSGMFFDASRFNRDIGNWDVSNVDNMAYMFSGTWFFNYDLNKWDTSSLEYTNGMFFNADKFNGDISNWNTSKVVDMSNMFQGAYSFNCDISNWDVSSVIDMKNMFNRANAFNCDLSKWKLNDNVVCNHMFSNSNIEIDNKPIKLR